MTIGAIITRTLPLLRKHAESMMVDTVRIRRVTGMGAINETTLVETPTYLTIYTGKGRVQLAQPTAVVVTGVALDYTIERPTIHIPVASCAPKIDDVVDIQTAALDVNLVGRVYRVAALLHKSQATTYRLLVEEVVT